ncbi:ADP-ribosylglycohydrolase family protein, partial [Candidatus Sumerlaeota bacterium]|nr:ADP-ribosylglycohydrolase family protein [Candidatus Sumerlaeota bacterium]
YVDAREAWEERPHRWRLPGLHSDETQQALSLIRVALDRGDVTRAAVANLWRRMASEPRDPRLVLGAHRGFGVTFSRAIKALVAGESAPGQPSAGSGAAARLAPLGLLMRDEPDRLTETVIDLSLLTHTDPRAIAGALSAAHAVALAAGQSNRDCGAILEDLRERVHEGEVRLLRDHRSHLSIDSPGEGDPIHAMSRALGAVPGLISEGDIDLALKTLVRQGNHLAPSRPLTSPNAGFAPLTVSVALLIGLGQQSFAQSISRLAGEGKESDTAAAIAGAVLGARHGEESIPADWREDLIARAEIEQFADALADPECAHAAPDLVEMETALTLRECDARAPLEDALAKRRARSAKRAPASPGKSKPKPPSEPLPFAPPPQTYLRDIEDPEAKRRERAARGRKRVGWKEERRRGKRR